MIKSETKELYEQIKKLENETKEKINKLQQEIQQIRDKEHLNFKHFKAIVKYTKSVVFGYSIQNIYFDTLNYFSTLKEMDIKSENWIVEPGIQSRGDITPITDYLIHHPITRLGFYGNIIDNKAELKIDGEMKYELKQNICSIKSFNDDSLKVLDIYISSQKLFIIVFNPYILTYEVAIDMSNQIIRFYYKFVINDSIVHFIGKSINGN
jgi:hypothetical protein